MLAQPKRTHLNRALSKLGLCSRTIGEGWILAGRVRVNGQVARDPEFWVEIGTDKIEVDALGAISSTELEQGSMPSSESSIPRAPIYLCMHKPAGYVTTRRDELGRQTVYDLLPSEFTAESAWIFPVGRLDLESEGLLLMTNDGEWANLLTDPEFHVEKTYRVKLDGKPLPSELEQFRNGMMLEGRQTLPARVDPEAGGWNRVVITEGRNRQIRKMFHALGYKVKRLVRISIGFLDLGDLKPGQIRILKQEFVQKLRVDARAQ